MVGYTVFFHKYDATFPDLYTLRYGFNILNESLEIIPMIGLTLTSPTTFDDMKPGSTEVVTPGSLKPYYGLKFQKMITDMGGVFLSVEYSKLNFLTAGFKVKINGK